MYEEKIIYRPVEQTIEKRNFSRWISLEHANPVFTGRYYRGLKLKQEEEK